MLTVDQITQNIVNQLRLLDPTVSAEIGTPERKLIEATAEMIASTQVDFVVLNQQHDLSTLSGGRLDAYLSIFNFGRQSATPAYGSVRFARKVASPNAIVIPLGSQIVANTTDFLFPTLTYVTTQTAVLEGGQLFVEVPVICTVAGTVGNIDANRITGFGGLKTVNGITTITNPQPIVGGIDAENDAQYKVRFQNTFLRNISGTYDMFLALAVSQSGVTKANVVGPMSRYQEYMQVPADRDAALATQAGGYDDTGTRFPHKRTSALSTIPFSKYTYQNNYYLTDGTIDPATAFFYRPGVDFAFNTPPIDATGVGGTNEVQGITVDATGGTFTLSFEGVETDPIAENAAAATVEAELESLSTIGVGNVTVSGAAGGPFTVTFVDELGSLNVPMLVENDALITGGAGVSIVETTPGVAAAQTDDPSTTTPNVTFLNPYDANDNPTGNPSLVTDSLTLLEHAYVSANSRNEYAFGVLNCVDAFIDGQLRASASSTEIIPGESHDLQNTDTEVWTYQKLTVPKVINFRRVIDGTACPLGNKIQPLYWQPVIDLPESIQVGASTFYKANFWNADDSTYYNSYDSTSGAYSLPAHYALAVEVNGYHGTIRSRNGIEWFMSGNNALEGQLPSDTGDNYSGLFISDLIGTEHSVNSYFYDQNISDLQAIMEKNKQVTTDVLVHKAKLRYFRPIITIMYTLGATRSVVDVSIAAALGNFFRNQYFGSTIQLADVLRAVHNVPGVDNVRWTNDTPAGNKLVEVGKNGTDLDGGPYYVTSDFLMQDSELPASPDTNAVTITVRAQNTWGT